MSRKKVVVSRSFTCFFFSWHYRSSSTSTTNSTWRRGELYPSSSSLVSSSSFLSSSSILLLIVSSPTQSWRHRAYHHPLPQRPYFSGSRVPAGPTAAASAPYYHHLRPRGPSSAGRYPTQRMYWPKQKKLSNSRRDEKDRKRFGIVKKREKWTQIRVCFI